jgi:hypothetical protein
VNERVPLILAQPRTKIVASTNLPDESISWGVNFCRHIRVSFPSRITEENLHEKEKARRGCRS